MLKKGLYRGFSSYEYERTKRFLLTDLELVKRDLLNHIFTSRGERVGQPWFGTRIPNVPFEPLDEVTIDVVREDLITVFTFDPRVQMLNLSVDPDYDTYSIIASARLLYIELDMVDDMVLNIRTEDSA